MNRYKSQDAFALTALVMLWMIFFWRLLTPIASDQAAFKQGDFSGQFVAFGAYQYERFAEGEIPLWNPYNNGGLPFIADTQAAVFYPPRLLTIGLSILSGEWTYNALQMEAILHVLLFSLLMYLFVRRLTIGSAGSSFGAFISAVVAAYGGFISGYPPLQLALLEASIWLPLAALGILETTRSEVFGWRWLLLAGFALGLSWMAGHPQTSWFSTYLLVAWLAYRIFIKRYSWYYFISGTALMGIITLGITAITLLPGIEYLALASRAEMGFDAKGNGFPFQDILQFILPGSVSLFSPLYVGIPALVFCYLALRYRRPNSIFWFGAALIGLIHSFGANSAFYHAVYNLLPGLRFFRGQERAAFLVANSLAILAGIGATHLAAWSIDFDSRPIRRMALVLFALVGGLTALILISWLAGVGDISQHVDTAVFSTVIASLLLALITWHTGSPNRRALILIGLLVVFELVSVNIDADSNYDSHPANEQLNIEAPALIQSLLDNAPSEPQRVDGFRGLQANYGSLYQIADIRGISPLFLSSAQNIIYRDYNHNPLAWELFAVRYVFSEREAFSTATQVIANGSDRDGAVYLHELDNPRPFALLLYQADVVDSDEFASALLNDVRFDPRQSVILLGEPGIDLPKSAPGNATVLVTDFAAESFTIVVSSSENAVLSLAQVDYPGWYATLDGEATEIIRAYGALTAIAVPAGDHIVELVYNPISYRIGGILSLFTWATLAILSAFWLAQNVSAVQPPEQGS